MDEAMNLVFCRLAQHICLGVRHQLKGIGLDLKGQTSFHKSLLRLHWLKNNLRWHKTNSVPPSEWLILLLAHGNT